MYEYPVTHDQINHDHIDPFDLSVQYVCYKYNYCENIFSIQFEKQLYKKSKIGNHKTC